VTITRDRLFIVLKNKQRRREEFLEKIETFDPNLKRHINRYRDFINLINEFGEKVIQQEGLNLLECFPVVPNWSSLIEH
jgi:hypothetical protein